MFTFKSSLKRRLALAALIGILPLPVVGSAMAEENASDLTSEAAFETSFVPYAALPDTPEAQGNVVDITDIDPPVEVEAKPATRSLGNGIASYYGQRFHGRRTANGERFDMNAMTAAHKTLPFGTLVEVTNPRNGKSVTVRINDRGPYAHGRTIDLSEAAASEIGIVQRGHGNVELEVVL